MKSSRHYRSIFISDIHLGTADCQADLLLEFLQYTSSDYLYLVGDIVDFWKLRNAIYWPRIKNSVLNMILEKAKNGTQVIYIPGNHDEILRDFTGSHYHGIDLRQQAVHQTLQGKRLLVLHGDVFDTAVRNMRWLETLGSSLYDFVMVLSRIYNRIRKQFGYTYWSFAAFIKYRFKEAVRYIENFEMTATAHASKLGFDGIICGHIHHPNKIEHEGTSYFNTGDWVEHCTALAEDEFGNLSIVDWIEVRYQLIADEQFPRAAA